MQLFLFKDQRAMYNNNNNYGVHTVHAIFVLLLFGQVRFGGQSIDFKLIQVKFASFRYQILKKKQKQNNVIIKHFH